MFSRFILFLCALKQRANSLKGETLSTSLAQWRKNVKNEWKEMQRAGNEKAVWVMTSNKTEEIPHKEWTQSLREDLRIQLGIGSLGCLVLGGSFVPLRSWMSSGLIGIFDASLTLAISTERDRRETANWQRLIAGQDFLLIFAPAVFEELIFRTLVLWTDSYVVLFFSALLFATVHTFDHAQRDHATKMRRFLCTTKSALLYGFTAKLSGALGPAVLAHSLHNYLLLSSVSLEVSQPQTTAEERR
mmetsp:Transcript_13898/g.20858  ORF Transcript_13898/g.20858 Transcript_13898/m.20858 type:complete len:245 (+) Transcript_13898:54-788(+)